MEIQKQISSNGGEEEEIKNKIKNKKRSRDMHVFGVVLFMLRRRRRKTKPFNNGFWRRVVDSFKLSKNDNITIMPSSNTTLLPSSSPASNNNADKLSEIVEVFTATSSSSSSGISGYGSAKSLHDMDCLDEEDDEECYGDVDEGDEMIDVKAEEFILRFYEQMRMQNQAYNTIIHEEGKEMIMAV